MNDWMIRWAFTAPFVTIGTQFCGGIAVLALISYGIAFLTVRVRGPWGWGVALSSGMLTVLVGFSTQILALGPLAPDQLSRAMKYSATGVLVIAMFAILEFFFRKHPVSALWMIRLSSATPCRSRLRARTRSSSGAFARMHRIPTGWRSGSPAITCARARLSTWCRSPRSW